MTIKIQKPSSFPTPQPNFFIQGHRGARGYLPENSIEGFIFCIENNILAMELDLIVLPSGEVVVSHEPYPHSEYVRLENCDKYKENIMNKNEFLYNFFKMRYEDIQKFDCGSKPHPRFRMQKKIKTYKPLLSEVLEVCINLTLKKYQKYPFFNFEIKYKQEWESWGQPPANFVVEKVLETIYKAKLPSTSFCIESFNTEILNYLKRQSSNLTLAFLIENVKDKMEILEKMQEISFIPEIIAPHFSILDRILVQYFLQKGIKTWTWTVNDPATALELYQQGVESLITDYPTQIKHYFEAQGIKVGL
jgi:glycerophosphoryl diester phosphodiesterase